MKKFLFSLAALMMMACAVVTISSCSNDDDDSTTAKTCACKVVWAVSEWNPGTIGADEMTVINRTIAAMNSRTAEILGGETFDLLSTDGTRPTDTARTTTLNKLIADAQMKAAFTSLKNYPVYSVSYKLMSADGNTVFEQFAYLPSSY